MRVNISCAPATLHEDYLLDAVRTFDSLDLNPFFTLLHAVGGLCGRDLVGRRDDGTFRRLRVIRLVVIIGSVSGHWRGPPSVHPETSASTIKLGVLQERPGSEHSQAAR